MILMKPTDVVRRPPHSGKAVVWCVGLLIGGCGGKAVSSNGPGQDSGVQDGASQDQSSGPGCPTSKPESGSRCSIAQTCEYGSDPRAGCDTLMKCSSGTWTTTQAPADAGCSTTNPSTCPSTFNEVTQGAECGTSPFECYFPEARCSCAVVVLQGGCIKSSCPPPTWDCDTGATDVAGKLEDAGCPLPRPRVGSSCPDADFEKSCNYGYCQNQADVAILCTSNVWQIENIDCPH